MTRTALTAALLLATGAPAVIHAEQLFSGGTWSAVAADDKARTLGDTVTVLISQSASASSKLQNNSSKKTDLGGSFAAGGINESANLNFGGSYDGKGAVVRTEQFVTQMTAQVSALATNGDLLIEGTQKMRVNGENTTIGVRGRIRPRDISADNVVLSSRIADAQINYDGKGFVSRSAKPGLINRIFSFLGIG